jgi:hypothetical protein
MLGLAAARGAVAARAGPAEPARPILERYRAVGSLAVPVEEISGWVCRGIDEGGVRTFLAVSDEDRYVAQEREIRGALHLVRLAATAEGLEGVGEPVAIALHVGAALQGIDPRWAAGGTPLDLEAITPLPGAPGHWLLAGEGSPESREVRGANHLYVVRYPADGPARAELLAALRVRELAGDTVNDRFEGVLATPRAGTQDAWTVHAFKERILPLTRTPGYLAGTLRREGERWSFAETDRGPDAAGERALTDDPYRLLTQADAAHGPGGEVWVLDRWRREVHVARLASDGIGLVLQRSLDLLEVLRSVPGEIDRGEPAALGKREPGFGREEALAFDASGWLWLAADRGSGQPSQVTVLAPREP